MVFAAMGIAFVVVTGVALVLVAGGAALTALWLIRHRDTEPHDPYMLVLPQFQRRVEPLRQGGQRVLFAWMGKRPPAHDAYVQEELPF